jgi:hypothetical protein
MDEIQALANKNKEKMDGTDRKPSSSVVEKSEAKIVFKEPPTEEKAAIRQSSEQSSEEPKPPSVQTTTKTSDTVGDAESSEDERLSSNEPVRLNDVSYI